MRERFDWTAVGTIVGLALAAAMVMALVTWAEIYHYRDCRRVGHTKAYCVLDIFR